MACGRGENPLALLPQPPSLKPVRSGRASSLVCILSFLIAFLRQVRIPWLYNLVFTEVNMSNVFRKIGAFCALLLVMAPAADSQTISATITGSVTDATGSVIPNVSVTATNKLTGIKTATKSNDAGIFTLAQLNDGTYSVTAEAAGFRTFNLQNITLQARDVRRVDIKLEVGAVNTAIEVMGGATLIETETPRISNTQTSLVLNTIPLNTRGLYAYLALAPGLQQQPGSSVIRFGGSRVNEENW